MIVRVGRHNLVKYRSIFNPVRGRGCFHAPPIKQPSQSSHFPTEPNPALFLSQDREGTPILSSRNPDSAGGRPLLNCTFACYRKADILRGSYLSYGERGRWLFVGVVRRRLRVTPRGWRKPGELTGDSEQKRKQTKQGQVHDATARFCLARVGKETRGQGDKEPIRFARGAGTISIGPWGCFLREPRKTRQMHNYQLYLLELTCKRGFPFRMDNG